jgi:hypothetical protein
MDYRDYWTDGYTWDEYFEDEIQEHRELWDGVYERHETPEWALRELGEIGGRWRLLVLTEDWCGDASNTVPVLARLAEESEHVELRLVKRDENLELMDRHLTGGSRSIPKAVILDDEFRPVADWGPRPEELQEFVISEKEKGERPTDEIYRDVRRWYARDGGESTLRELVEAIGQAASAEPVSAT